MKASDLLVVDVGVDAAALTRFVPGGTTPGACVIFLGDPGLPIDFSVAWTEPEVTRNGGKLATVAISTANRLAFAIVEAIERSGFGGTLLDYEGVPIRSLMYNLLADSLFDSLRPLVAVRHVLDGAQGAAVTFVSPSAKNLAFFRAIAPRARTICTSRRRARALGTTVWALGRCARDLAVRGGRGRDRDWSFGGSGAARVLFVAANAAGCEDKHPNSFKALTDAGLDVAILCTAGQRGRLPLPHFTLTDAAVSRGRQLVRWRHWARFRRHRADISELLQTIPGEPTFSELVTDLCEVAVEELLADGLYVALDLVDYFEAGIARLRPDVVLFDNRHLFGMCVALAARKCGVPAVWAQDGVCGTEEPGKMAMEADVCATWGRATERYLRGTGIDAERLRVVGAPFMDDLAARAFLDRDRLGAELDLDLGGTKPIISYMSIYFSREALGPFAFGGNPARHKAAVIEEVCRTVLALPDARLIIKLHPADSDHAFDLAVASRMLPRDRFAVTWRSDLLYDVLRLSDFVIVHDGSTVAVEAAALGRPIVSVDFGGIDGAGTNSWMREGIAIGVRAADEMLPATRAALFDAGARAALAERRPAFLREWVDSGDGKNCQRLVDVVLDAVTRRRR